MDSCRWTPDGVHQDVWLSVTTLVQKSLLLMMEQYNVATQRASRTTDTLHSCSSKVLDQIIMSYRYT